MQYSECSKSCSTTCQGLNIQEVCKEDCVDGCSCPGKTRLPEALFLSLCVFHLLSLYPFCQISHYYHCVLLWTVCVCVSVGKVLDGERCVEVSQCSCVHMGRHFPPGSSISQDCNVWWVHTHTSTNAQTHTHTHSDLVRYFHSVCRHGSWECTNEGCPGETTDWSKHEAVKDTDMTAPETGHCGRNCSPLQGFRFLVYKD